MAVSDSGGPDGPVIGCASQADASRADARFTLDEQTGPAVARLVRRLDGMPLAIERAEALGVTGLLDRLEDRFALLAGGDRTAPARQRSLAATVAWSYRLLDEDERPVFRAVSVFPGRSPWRPPRRSPGPGPGWRCCGWWTAHCWSRRGPGWTGGRGM